MENKNKEIFLEYVKHFTNLGNDTAYVSSRQAQIDFLKLFDGELSRLYEQLINDERAIISYVKSRLDK